MSGAAVLRVIAVGVGVAFFAGCSSDDPPQASTTTAPFTVWVLDEGLTPKDTGAPIANVTVAIDPLAGSSSERVTRTTEADGHVTFDAIDFSSGLGVAVSALSADHTLVTMLEASPETARAKVDTFGKPPSDLVIVLPRLDRAFDAASIGVRGTLQNKQAATSLVRLSTTAIQRVGSAATKEGSYALRGPRGAPFILLGHESQNPTQVGDTFTNEILRSFRVDAPASTTDQIVNIDLATASIVTDNLVRLRLEPPAGTVVPGARATAAVISADSALTLGEVQRSAPTADLTAFDVELEVSSIDIAPERAITRALVVTPNGERLIRTEQGVASATTTTTLRDFPPPVVVITPQVSRTLADPIPLDAFPPGAELEIQGEAAGQLFWILRGPPGGPRGKSVALPAPMGIDFNHPDVQLFGITLIARFDRIALPPHAEVYRRIATSRTIEVRRR